MELRNAFSKQTKYLFYESRYCFLCGRTDLPIEFHHIVGRDSNSPFNCSRICKECHRDMSHSEKEEYMLFNLTLSYLVRQRYQITEADKQFLLSYPHLLL